MFDEEVRKRCDEVEELSKSQSIKIHQLWLSRFANRVKTRTGKWRVGEHLWEGFGRDGQPSFVSTKALTQYARQEIDTFYVFDETGKHCYMCKSAWHPEFYDTGYDVYLMPEDGSWTVVFTHHNVAYFAYAD